MRGMVQPPAVLSNPTFAAFLHSEPLAVDLVNTHLFLEDSWVDLLDDRPRREQWLIAETGRLGFRTEDAAGFTDVAVDELRPVRAHAAAAIDAARHGTAPPARALSGLNRALRGAPAVPQLHWDGHAVVAETTRRAGPLGPRLAAGFAHAALELLTGSGIRQVRRCDAPSCVMLFQARNPRRRWCTPTICGNRARVARYHRRHGSEGQAAPPVS